MEVLVGPTTTFSIEVSSPPPPPPSSYAVTSSQASACIFLKEEDESADQSTISNGPDYSSDSSSSIGAPDDSGDEDEEEVNSAISSKGGGGGGGGGLGSLDSLEDSLPVKRGLSSHFSGKSKSFANLADTITVNRVKDLEKPENPFNKRRRLLMANKLCRKKSSFYTWRNPKSMPLLALNEHEEEEEEEEERGEEEDEDSNNGSRYNHQNDDGASPASSPEQNHHQLPKLSSKLQERKFRTSLKFHSCFSLADLQHQEEDEEYQ